MKKPGEERKMAASAYKYGQAPHQHTSANSIPMGAMPGQPSSQPATTSTTNGNMNLYFGYHNAGVDNPCCPSSSDSGVVVCGSGSQTAGSPLQMSLVPGRTLLEQAPEIGRILEEVQYIARRFREQDEGEAICGEWKFAAAMENRLCLVALSLYSSICTFTILMSAPNFIEAVSKDIA